VLDVPGFGPKHCWSVLWMPSLSPSQQQHHQQWLRCARVVLRPEADNAAAQASTAQSARQNLRACLSAQPSLSAAVIPHNVFAHLFSLGCSWIRPLALYILPVVRSACSNAWCCCCCICFVAHLNFILRLRFQIMKTLRRPRHMSITEQSTTFFKCLNLNCCQFLETIDFTKVQDYRSLVVDQGGSWLVEGTIHELRAGCQRGCIESVRVVHRTEKNKLETKYGMWHWKSWYGQGYFCKS
jgi:hypothetical protein